MVKGVYQEVDNQDTVRVREIQFVERRERRICKARSLVELAKSAELGKGEGFAAKSKCQ